MATVSYLYGWGVKLHLSELICGRVADLIVCYQKYKLNERNGKHFANNLPAVCAQLEYSTGVTATCSQTGS